MEKKKILFLKLIKYIEEESKKSYKDKEELKSDIFFNIIKHMQLSYKETDTFAFEGNTTRYVSLALYYIIECLEEVKKRMLKVKEIELAASIKILTEDLEKAVIQVDIKAKKQENALLIFKDNKIVVE